MREHDKKNIEGAKAGSKAKKPYIQKDTVASTQIAEILYGIGIGKNVGLINGLNSIILDGTRAVSSSGEVLLNGVTYEERLGLVDQEPLQSIQDVSFERSIEVEVTDEAPVVNSFNNKDVDTYSVRISIPALVENKDNGDSIAASVTYAIDMAVDGGAFDEVARYTVNEKITNGFEQDHEIDAPEGTVRTIRVRRITPESDSQLLVNRIIVSGITEIINAKFTHPCLHYVGLRFNAEHFNGIPKAVFHYKGREIQVPSNYDPIARTYSGLWDGTFKVAYSNNPAWVLYDILTSKHFGLGHRINASMINKWELYSNGVYCDELVPDGKGGQEPRFVCNNLILNAREDAFQVLKDIASVFRGQSFWNGQQIVTRIDAPRDAVYTLAMANVISYSYSGTADKARHNVIKVQYYDSTNDYKAAYEYASDYEAIAQNNGINELELSAFACTSAGQAQRAARYALVSEQTETNILKAKITLEGLNMELGDVFAFSDRFFAGTENGGRVVSVSGKTITLDRDASFFNGKSSAVLYVNGSDGKAHTYDVVSVANNVVTVDRTVTAVEPEHVWALTSDEVSLMFFRLEELKINPDDGSADIVAVQHVNSKFNVVDTMTSIDVPEYSAIDVNILKKPENITTNYNVRTEQGINITDIYVAWGQVKGASRYTVEMRRDSQAWQTIATVTGLTHTIENVSAGLYDVRITATDAFGNTSPSGNAPTLSVAGKTLPPPKLANLTAVGELFAIRANWSFPSGTDDSLAVAIEYTLTNPTNTGGVKQTLNVPYPQTTFTFNGLGANTKYWLRASIVDKYGQSGEPTAWISATADSSPSKIIDIISGSITQEILAAELKSKIDTTKQTADDAKTAASTAQTAANNAQTSANTAKTAADNAQTSANSAQTKANEAAVAITQEVKDRVAAVTKESTDRATAISAESSARAAAITKEVTDRNSAIESKATTLRTETDNKVATLKTSVDGQIATLSNGITKVTTDYQNADTKIAGDLSAYKTANDSAVSAVLQKAESAVSTGSANSSAITAINSQVTSIQGTLALKADASALNNFYTKTQADTKAAEIAAGQISAYDVSLTIGGVNLQTNADFSSPTLRNDWIPYSGTLSNEDSTLKYVATASVSTNRIEKRTRTLTNGKTYTLSLRMKCPQLPEFRTLQGASKLGETMPAVHNPDVYQDYSYTFKVTDATILNIRVYFTSIPVGGTVYLDKEQLEEGSKATTWRLAEQDTQDSLAANAQAIKDTNATVTSIGNTQTAQAQDISKLRTDLTTTNNNVATKADASALTATNVEVTNAKNAITSQGQQITALESSVGTKNRTYRQASAPTAGLVVGDLWINTTAGKNNETKRWNGTAWDDVTDPRIAANTTAVSNLQTTTTQQGNTITTQGNAITTLQGQMTTANNNIATKADLTAFNSLDTKVTNLDGTVKTQGNDITSIKGSITTLTNGLATKAESSALNNYYQKAESDSRATTIAAGQVAEYNSKLTIGGQNLYYGPNPVVLRSQTSPGQIVFTEIASGNTQRFNYLTEDNLDLSGIKIGDPTIASIEIYVPSTDTSDYTIQFGTYRFSAAGYIYAPTVDVKNLPKDKWIKLTTAAGTYTSGQPATGINLVFNLVGRKTAGDEIRWRNFMMEKATTASAFRESDKVTQKQLDANAQAISNTNTELTNTKNTVTSQSSDITTLKNNVNTINGALTTKADASAMNAIETRVTNAEGVNTSQGSAITTLENTVNHATTGLSSKASAAALTEVDNKVTAANGRIDTTNSNVTALTGRVSTVEGAVSTKAEAAALTALTTRVSNAEGVNTSQGSAITSLENSVNHATTGLASKASSSALTAVDNKVTAANGRIDTANAATTALEGRVSTVEGDVSKKADASALTALTTRVGNAEGVNTSQGSAITTLQNTVNHSTTGLATKASTAALTATNSEVTRINGVVTGHTNQLTQLTSDINTINGTLATKANASALNDIYTKTQTDTKATEIAAGEISKYDASLVIGGTNLFQQSNYSKHIHGGTINNSTTSAVIKVEPNTTYTISYTVTVSNRFGIFQGDLPDGDITKSFTNTSTILAYVSTTSGTKINRTFTTGPTGEYIYVYLSYGVGQVKEPNLKVEKGNKATDWSPSPRDTQASLDANATAIENTNAEVSRVDGRVTTESNRITSLTGRVDNVVGDLAKKADASALSSLTTRVESEEGKSTSQGTAITALQNTVNHATTGLATKASSTALTAVDNKVTAVDGRVTTTNSNVAALQGELTKTNNNVALKADSSAVDALTNRVTTTENNATVEANKVTQLQSGLSAVKTTADAALPRVTGGTGYKSFKNVLNAFQGIATSSANIVIITPITFTNKMFRITGKGYNYTGNKSVIDFAVSGYIYSQGNILQPGAVNAGTMDIRIRLGKKDDRLVVILSPVGGNWAYPQFTVDAEIGYTTPPDTWQNGWSSVLWAEDNLAANGVTVIREPTTFNPKQEIEANATATSNLRTDVTNLDGVVKSQATQIINLNSNLSTTNTNVTTAQQAAQNAMNAANAKGKVFYSNTQPDAAERLAQNLWLDTTGGANTPKRWNGSAWVAVTDKVATDALAAANTANANLSNKADASVVSNLSTRVTNAEGQISSQATQYTNLSTTVGNHTTSINQQASSIDGIMATASFQINNNGLVSGWNLTSQIINGVVRSQIGFSSDTFFIGDPTLDKKPFIQYSTNTVINGVSVPPGTYITDAFIANGTIGEAKIGNAAITTAKIKDLAVESGKIADLAVSTIKIQDEAVTVPVGARYSRLSITTDSINDGMRAYAQQQGKVRPDGGWDFPTTLNETIEWWEAATPPIFSITIPRAGGKCRIDLSINVSHTIITFVAISPGNQPETVLRDTRLFVSLYRGTTLVGRTSIAPTSFLGTTVGFTGNIALMALDDNNMTGPVTYTARISFGYVGANTGIKVTPYLGILNLDQTTVSALELKK